LFILSKIQPIKNNLKLIVLLTLWAITFIPVYPSLVYTWLNHSNNSHGILVPLISVFLIWQKRTQIKATPISNSNWGILIMGGSMVLYILSYAGSVAVVSRAMIVFSLIGLILFTLGSGVFSTIKFPLFYLLFMVPVPVSIYSLIAFPLQIFATKVSTFIINLLSIPAYREGNMLYFAQTHLEVAEACSGLRSMMTFIMLSFLFAYMMDENWKKRIVIVLSSIPLALFANILRVTGTGILAHFYGDTVARGFLHEFSGLAVFAFGFILLYLEYILLNKAMKKL
jgi:exosortase